MRVRPIFAWFDLWVGVFIDRPKRRVYVFPLPCIGVVIERTADPTPPPETHPDHQWVWVDGNNVDAVVIYREWQRYQRASAERWEQESNETADPTPPPETP